MDSLALELVGDCHVEGSSTVCNNRKRPRKTTSSVWDEFEKFVDKNRKEKARCKRCKVEYVAGGSKDGTSNLHKHIPKCPKRVSHDISNNRKRTRKTTSSVWDEFEKFIDNNGREKARCKRCKAEYVAGGSKDGTSNLHKHIPKCLKRISHDVGQMLIDREAKVCAKKIDQMVYRDKMVSAILKHNYPYSIVEHEGLRDVHSYLNPDLIHITRSTIEDDTLRIHKREKEKLKNMLQRAPSRICLTSDVWTSIATEGYLCLTVHFVDEEWRLQDKILNFCHMPPPHTSIALSDTVYQFLKDWGIEKKVFSLTLDSASANDNTQDLLRSQLDLHNALLCNGEFFYVRCSAHVLNLIVQESLKVLDEVLQNIRNSVKYVKGSEDRILKFEECAKQVGLDIATGLRLDVPTKWDSTFFMLESVLLYRRAFERLSLVDEEYKYCPSCEEWTRGEQICRFLQPFADITTLISGSHCVTANLYFRCVWKIQLVLLEERENLDLLISKMAKSMYERFEDYWNCYSVVLAFAIVLDPRYKLKYVDYCYRKIDESTCEGKVANVKDQLKRLYEEYASKFSSQAANTRAMVTQPSIGSSSRRVPSLRVNDEYEFAMFLSSRYGNTTGSELGVYFDEPVYDIMQHPDLDVLEYWKASEHRYPILSLMARDIMSIPIATVASESTFSIGNRILTKYRSALLLENAELLITTRNWLYGFSDVDDLDLDKLDVKLSKAMMLKAREASNSSLFEK